MSEQLFSTIKIQRDGDDHAMDWHFDSEEQHKRAVNLCGEYGARIWSQRWHSLRPLNDFITDADELRTWLAFDYITKD